MKKILALLAASLSVAACIYPYTPELEEAPEGVLSVDGNICIGSTSIVRLGTLMSLWSTEWKPVDFSSARVWVEDDAGDEYPGTSDYGPSFGGSYFGTLTPSYTIDTRNAPRDRRYRLCVEALGDRYATDWNDVLPPPRIRDISFSADEEDVHVAVSVDGGEAGTGYALLSYDETWEFHADYPLDFDVFTYDDNLDSEVDRIEVAEKQSTDWSKYWCWRSIDNRLLVPVDYTGRTEDGFSGYPLMSFSRRDSRNHRRYCINVTAKSISKETYRFLHNLQENTDGGDNLFTPNPGEIAGNLRCESNPERTVLGYAVFSFATSKRAFLDSRYRKAVRAATLVYPLQKDYVDLWKQGFLPLAENDDPDYNPEEEGPYGWGAPRCYDCTAMGGTKTKPDYWDDSGLDDE